MIISAQIPDSALIKIKAGRLALQCRPFCGLAAFQDCHLSAEPVYCPATPHDALPSFRKPVSSITRTASPSARCSTTVSRTMSCSASASHRPRRQKRLLPPRTRITRSLGAHPARLPALIPKQHLQEQSRVHRNTLRREQSTYSELVLAAGHSSRSRPWRRSSVGRPPWSVFQGSATRLRCQPVPACKLRRRKTKRTADMIV
jgi:hypothetical protein